MPDTKTSSIIRKMRKNARMTQAEFAQILNCPKRTIEKWEYRGDPPDYEIKLIEYFLKNEGYIMEEKNGQSK